MCPENAFEIAPDYPYVSLILFKMVLQTVILFLQIKCGPTFFLPKCLKPTTFDFYKSYKECKNIKPEFDTV